ncbi:PREDICTED: protein EXORDIUM-like 6 [Tarenaya hassleriana]|uniref:protein EXORDIUM-like 6 n=1 Tax=Tarenaya hassleriana TaxID=28532 RepID=UPI00053C7CB5|nr:PREDICTED: protein EXORDIUM-like 6 [Tarenaya hassleriana]
MKKLENFTVAMASSPCSSSSNPSVLVLSVLLFLLLAPLSLSRKTPSLPAIPDILSHGGSVFNGTLDLSLLWYGRFTSSQKDRIHDFIESLNFNAKEGLDPKVSKWWRVVESYQIAGKISDGVAPRIPVKVTRSYADEEMKYGKELTSESIEKLVETATAGGGDNNSGVVPVIMVSWDVKVEGFCNTTCQRHELIGEKQAYIVVSNPEVECPGTCAWPFHTADKGPHGMTYQPPSGDLGADAMVLQLATAMANYVTNPTLTGFFFTPESSDDGVVEVATACPGIFGSGAFPGFTGKIRIDPATGGAFNAHGVKHLKFLVPALWNPKTSSCWTPM